MTVSPNSVIIDLSGLGGNLRQVRNLVGRDTRIMGVVKSDAYGHGLLEVGRALQTCGIDSLGVAYLHEAIALREGGVGLPIMILCGIQTREESREVIERRLTPVLHDLTVAETLSQECQRMGRRIRIHVKVDTGMGRLGIACNHIGPSLRKIISFKNLEIEGLTSHLATADERDTRFTDEQIERFEAAISTGRSMGLRLPLNSMANSAGIIGHKRSHFDMVRPGIMLYGGLPSPGFITSVSLAPLMRFHTHVVQVRDLPDKTSVSYGRTYRTKGPRTIAYLSAGYGDGLPRRLSNRGRVLVAGKKASIIGTVCMNLTACDITGWRGVTPGDEAIFLGCQGGECIRADDMAMDAGTISYEIFCAIGRKNMRDYSQ
jgi:alanine racemase